MCANRTRRHRYTRLLGVAETKLESVELELTDEEFARYARFAHDRDITFDHLVENALRDFILQHEREKA